VVGVSPTAAGRDHAFIYSGGTMTDMFPGSSATSSAAAINDAGQITGRQGQQAFLYEAGVATSLGALGDGSSSGGTAINASGQVVGYSTIDAANETRHAFLYSGGIMQDLGTVGSYFSLANAINTGGLVVGDLYDPDADLFHGFYYDGQAMWNMDDLLTTPGWKIGGLRGINDSGWVVGTGVFDPDGPGGTAPITRAVLLTPVPEPSTLALCAAGYISWAAWALRRRRSGNARG